jgi:hypothetical protein
MKHNVQEERSLNPISSPFLKALLQPLHPTLTVPKHRPKTSHAKALWPLPRVEHRLHIRPALWQSEAYVGRI